MKFYQCQAYIRHKTIPADNKQINEKIDQLIASDSSSTALKRHADEITNNIEKMDKTEQESAMKLVKHLERKRRKQDRIEKKTKYIEENLKKIPAYIANPEEYLKKRNQMKYTLCETCKNPRGENCKKLFLGKCHKHIISTKNTLSHF